MITMEHCTRTFKCIDVMTEMVQHGANINLDDIRILKDILQDDIEKSQIGCHESMHKDFRSRMDELERTLEGWTEIFAIFANHAWGYGPHRKITEQFKELDDADRKNSERIDVLEKWMRSMTDDGR